MKSLGGIMKIDTGLRALLVICKFQRILADEKQIIHEFALGEKSVTSQEIMKIAKSLEFKVKKIENYRMPLVKLPVPCIGQKKNGQFFVIMKVTSKGILFFDPKVGQPKLLNIQQFDQLWNRTILLFKHKKSMREHPKFGFNWFIPTILNYKKLLIEVLVAAFTIQIVGLFSPIMTQVVVDKVLVHNSLSTLNILVIGLLIITIFELIMGIAKNYVFSITTSKIDILLSAKLFNHLLRLPLRYFETRRIGDTVARVRELENIRRFLTGTPLTSVLDSFFIIIYIAVMFFYSSQLTWITLASIPIFTLLSAIATPLFKNSLDEKFDAGAEVQSFLVETVTGINTVKSLALEPVIKKRWEDYQAKYTIANFKSAILSGNVGAIGQFIQKGFDLLLLWYGANLVIDNQLSVGQLIAFRMLASRVSGPVLRLVQLWQEFQQTGISVERIGDIFNTRTEITQNSSKTRLPKIKGEIIFENVSFRYDINDPETIRQMNFKVPAGKVVGVVGRSGSGKSTLAKLIQRLYIPESGKILVDGVNISIADTVWLRRQIGVVLQENFLFNMTIRENIAINKSNASIEKVIEVAKIAGAHEFILEFPNGYDTMIGEKGSGLSGGQKQRIAIARALLLNPRILIFDEATSALDYESERIIQQNLKKISKNRTVLIIAHRLSTLKNADLIMSIDKGSLVEFGSRLDLLNRNGLFRYLYQQQEEAE